MAPISARSITALATESSLSTVPASISRRVLTAQVVQGLIQVVLALIQVVLEVTGLILIQAYTTEKHVPHCGMRILMHHTGYHIMVKVVGHAVTVDPKIFIDSWLCKSLVVANKGFHIRKLQVIKEKQYRAKK